MDTQLYLLIHDQEDEINVIRSVRYEKTKWKGIRRKMTGAVVDLDTLPVDDKYVRGVFADETSARCSVNAPEWREGSGGFFWRGHTIFCCYVEPYDLLIDAMDLHAELDPDQVVFKGAAE